jgi:DNA-binding transcriptional MerR regulator
MRIGELARRTGTTPSAIRFYEKRGVLPAPARVAGRRAYGADAENALHLLQGLKAAGFTLAEIRSMHAVPLASRTPALWRSYARAKLDAIDAEILRLAAARRHLAGAMRCRCAGRADACALAQPVASTRSKGPR